MRVHWLQHVAFEDLGCIAPWLAARGHEVRRTALHIGEDLPTCTDFDALIVMGGPMNVDERARHPWLAGEKALIRAAIDAGRPVLGICLGAQLLARALGVEVRPGEEPELGYAPVEVFDPEDPIVGALAPSTTVLHWHGDVFDLPRGATHLARSVKTGVQAFRHGNAWGVLFHPESDFALLEAWLAIPEMVREASRALGDEGAAALPAQAEAAEAELVKRTTPGLEAFASLVACQRPR